MANFKTHVGGGAALGAGIGAFAAVVGLSGDDIGLAVLMALAACVGSVAPDIDSDSSVPFHVTFGILSLSAGTAVLVFAMERFPGDWPRIVACSLAAVLTMWGVVGWIFRKFTRHRGMVHSIPTAALVGLTIFLLACKFGIPEWEAFLVAVSFSSGFVLHLILDELFAAVAFRGLKIGPKKSFGSALKLTAKSRPVTFAVYAAIAAILLLNQGRLASLAQKLAEFV